MALSFQTVNARVETGSAAELDDIAVGTFAQLYNPSVYNVVRIHAQKGGDMIMLSSWGTAADYNLLVEHTRATLKLKIHANGSNGDLPTMPSAYHWVASSWDEGGADGDQHLYHSTAVGTLLQEVTSYTTQQVGSGAKTSDAADSYVIGNRGATRKRYYGNIAVSALWSRQLSLGELAAFQRYGWVGANCVGMWILGRQFGTGSQVDLSGNDNNGSLSGGPTLVTDEAPLSWLVSKARIIVPAVSGVSPITGIADFNLPVLTVTGAGGFAGIADFNLPVPTVTGIGETLKRYGIADFNLPVPTLTAVGETLKRYGIADFNLPVPTVTGIGDVPVKGIADFNLPMITLTGIGDVPVKGIADFNIPILTVTGIGETLKRYGTADFNLPMLAITAIGNIPIDGIANFNLPALDIPAIGDILIKGVADFNLPSLDLDATGIVGDLSPVVGIANFNLPSLWITTQGGVDIPMVNIFSTSGQSGAETGTAFTLSRKAGTWFINRDVLAQVILGSGSATIHIEVSLDGGSTFADIVASGTASAIHAFNLPPIIRVRLSAATAATVNVWLDADLVVSRVNN